MNHDADTPKHPGGRPLKFPSVEELQARIDAYFQDCDPHMVEEHQWVEKRDSTGKLVKDSNGQTQLVELKIKRLTKQIPYTITGLALYLDTSRETLLEYQEREEFVDTIKKAKVKCENYAEQMLFSTTPTGSIFNLKNNYGWRDKTEVDSNINAQASISLVEFVGDDDETQDTVR